VEIKVSTDDLVSVAQAALELGKPRVTIYRWVEDRKVVAIRLGGILFVPVSEVERLKREINTQAAQSNQTA